MVLSNVTRRILKFLVSHKTVRLTNTVHRIVRNGRYAHNITNLDIGFTALHSCATTTESVVHSAIRTSVTGNFACELYVTLTFLI